MTVVVDRLGDWVCREGGSTTLQDELDNQVITAESDTPGHLSPHKRKLIGDEFYRETEQRESEAVVQLAAGILVTPAAGVEHDTDTAELQCQLSHHSLQEGVAEEVGGVAELPPAPASSGPPSPIPVQHPTPTIALLERDAHQAAADLFHTDLTQHATPEGRTAIW